MEIVGTAGNGEDAVDMIRKSQPDVVLLDLIMPKMDGLGVMERLKEDKNMTKIKKDHLLSSQGRKLYVVKPL